jgi:hypothetical protein
MSICLPALKIQRVWRFFPQVGALEPEKTLNVLLGGFVINRHDSRNTLRAETWNVWRILQRTELF